MERRKEREGTESTGRVWRYSPGQTRREPQSQAREAYELTCTWSPEPGSLGLGPLEVRPEGWGPQGEATQAARPTQSPESTVPLGSQLALEMGILGPYLLQGLEDALPLTQLLDAQGYLVAGTFGDILW